MKRYGLLGSAKSIKCNSTNGPKSKCNAKVLAAFAEDSDSEQDKKDLEDPTSRKAVNRRLLVEQESRKRQMESSQMSAVFEDPSIYEYDEVIDELPRKINKKDPDKKAPQYIHSLMEQAKMRNIEQDRAYDRKLAKEREEGDKEFGNAEMKFITSSYKKKLMEQKKWEIARDIEASKEEKAESEMKLSGGMTAFYSNLLTKNIAMGSSVEHAKSAFTTGSKKHAEAVKFSSKKEAENQKIMETEGTKLKNDIFENEAKENKISDQSNSDNNSESKGSFLKIETLRNNREKNENHEQLKSMDGKNK
eukprot:CAMPEP_0171455646 /NCGR_PEP_ID=MMETSP0945-20130129/2458_1 /TAXON_ID=109269 /ORGANISM="Vaucheria litorea, Strain CCMP2940" /LENGTH=304 /DNA_ID=CAMNT_0011980929 /DNA_START=265 /DNA_END=1176 /DNA_ORIENTATION=-